MTINQIKSAVGLFLILISTTLAVVGFVVIPSTADRLTLIGIYIAFLTFVLTVLLRHLHLLSPVLVPVWGWWAGVDLKIKRTILGAVAVCVIGGVASLVVSLVRGPLDPVTVSPQAIGGAIVGTPYDFSVTQPPVGRDVLQIKFTVAPVGDGVVGLCAAPARIQITPVLDGVARTSGTTTVESGDLASFDIEGPFSAAGTRVVVTSRPNCAVDLAVAEASYRG